MRFPPADSVAATPRRIAAGQEGLFTLLFSSWIDETNPFDLLNCPLLSTDRTAAQRSPVEGVVIYRPWGRGASAPINEYMEGSWLSAHFFMKAKKMGNWLQFLTLRSLTQLRKKRILYQCCSDANHTGLDNYCNRNN